jgi:hypothetical protein
MRRPAGVRVVRRGPAPQFFFRALPVDLGGPIRAASFLPESIRRLAQLIVRRRPHYSISRRAFFARAAPIAVFTSFSSSGGGSTAGKPSDSIHSSRHQPVL